MPIYIDGKMTGALTIPQSFSPVAPPYTGAYEVAPERTAQTLQTAGKLMTKNLTINPIPSNYGLITWDGAVLTVS